MGGGREGETGGEATEGRRGGGREHGGWEKRFHSLSLLNWGRREKTTKWSYKKQRGRRRRRRERRRAEPETLERSAGPSARSIAAASLAAPGCRLWTWGGRSGTCARLAGPRPASDLGGSVWSGFWSPRIAPTDIAKSSSRGEKEGRKATEAT